MAAKTALQRARKATAIGRSGSSTAHTSLGMETHDALEFIDVLKSGLPFSAVIHFAGESSFALSDIARVLQIPPRTLARRKQQGTLTRLESERLARLAGIFDKAVDLFDGDKDAASTWLRKPAKAFANRSPLELAESETGARAVEDLIGRLEFGVYS